MVKNSDAPLITTTNPDQITRELKTKKIKSGAQMKKLQRHKNHLRALADKETPLIKRWRHLVQKEGFQESLIAPILSTLGGLLLSNWCGTPEKKRPSLLGINRLPRLFRLPYWCVMSHKQSFRCWKKIRRTLTCTDLPGDAKFSMYQQALQQYLQCDQTRRMEPVSVTMSIPKRAEVRSHKEETSSKVEPLSTSVFWSHGINVTDFITQQWGTGLPVFVLIVSGH